MPIVIDVDVMLARRKMAVAFEFFTKIGIPYYCFHDRDVAPEGETFAEFRDNLDALVDPLKLKRKSPRKPDELSELEQALNKMRLQILEDAMDLRVDAVDHLHGRRIEPDLARQIDGIAS